ncbi:MAG: hypothetical protein IT488_09675 [Gammaproteobacteria bacterium]|nr:hypothetical protein [Gammaproteobacteria bacterium]
MALFIYLPPDFDKRLNGDPHAKAPRGGNPIIADGAPKHGNNNTNNYQKQNILWSAM